MTEPNFTEQQSTIVNYHGQMEGFAAEVQGRVKMLRAEAEGMRELANVVSSAAESHTEFARARNETLTKVRENFLVFHDATTHVGIDLKRCADALDAQADALEATARELKDVVTTHRGQLALALGLADEEQSQDAPAPPKD